MKQVVFGFGLLILGLLVLFRVARFQHFSSSPRTEWWIAGFSLLFFIIGIFISRNYFLKKQTVIVEKEIPAAAAIDEKQLQKTGLSPREYEILQLIGEGLSNQQIAGRLFVSENTIKKHISNLFLKLEVERRTEAVKKAKDLKIIA
jgi:DNA-binding CsgD family transcriptional regulator